MSQQLNSLWSQTILFYCYQQNNKYYDIYANICGLYNYDEIGNLYIVEWYINNEVPQPSLEALVTLCANNSSDIQQFYHFHYLLPSSIKNNFNFPQISTNDLNLIPTSQLIKGYYIYNSTVQEIQKFNGIGWEAV